MTNTMSIFAVKIGEEDFETEAMQGLSML